MTNKYISMILTLSLIGLTSCGSNNEYTDYPIGEYDDSFDNNQSYYEVESNGYDGAVQDSMYISPNTENYANVQETDFKSTMTDPISTFSADVDTASYTNIRRFIQDGSYVPTDAVRIEEMLNYFDYDYPQPSNNEPFSSTIEITDCPWNENTKLMLVGLQTSQLDISESPPSNIVFLIDVSGSMMDIDKLPLIQEAFSMLASNLRANDRVSIVTYAGSDEIVLNGCKGTDIDTIVNAINNLSAGGGTNGSQGIISAYNLAEKYFIDGGNNRVILATDGDLNLGITNQDDLQSLIEKERETGVYLSVLGFGTGNLNDSLMETLADNGNGNYSYIDSLKEAKKVLVNELSSTLYTVAKDVKFQIEFNSANVKGYRLIGYDNRVMNAEDFNDDTKDAGEVGAGHTVTALYEVALTDSKQEIPSTDLTYNTIGTSDSSNWATLSIRYKNPNQDESQLIQNTIDDTYYSKTPKQNVLFAGAVAQFGMLLKDSQYKGTSNYTDIIQQLKQVETISTDENKEEFLSLVSAYKYISKTSSNNNEYYYD